MDLFHGAWQVAHLFCAEFVAQAIGGNLYIVIGEYLIPGNIALQAAPLSQSHRQQILSLNNG